MDQNRILIHTTHTIYSVVEYYLILDKEEIEVEILKDTEKCIYVYDVYKFLTKCTDSKLYNTINELLCKSL